MNELCTLCKRELGAVCDEHHLIPKTFKGKEKVWLHKICHQKIHTVFTERELLRYYHTIERLLENEEIQKFVKWVQNKSIEFYSSSNDTNLRKGKRRR